VEKTTKNTKRLLTLSLILILIYFLAFGYNIGITFDTLWRQVAFNALGIIVFSLAVYSLIVAWKKHSFNQDKSLLTLFNIIVVVIFLHIAPLRALGFKTAFHDLLEIALFTPQTLQNILLVFGVILTMLIGLITYQVAPRDNVPQDRLDWLLISLSAVFTVWLIIALFINPFQSFGVSLITLFVYYSYLSRRHKNIYKD